jgi:hypothetical protein
MKSWSTWLGVASTLALVGVTVAACDGPTIIIQNVIGDAGGATTGDQDASADADARDGAAAVTACVPGTLAAPTTPLYLEVMVLVEPRGDVIAGVQRFLNGLPLNDPALAIGLKTDPDPNLDPYVFDALDGGARNFYIEQIRDLPQLLSEPRRTSLVAQLTAAQTKLYGLGCTATTSNVAQLRSTSAPVGVLEGGRRAMLVVKRWDASDLSRTPHEEATDSVPVLIGAVHTAMSTDWSEANYQRGPTAFRAAGLDGDEHCDDSLATPNSSFGTGSHQVCVPVLVGQQMQTGTPKLSSTQVASAMATVLDELRACEYAVSGFDSRFGGSLSVAWKDVDGSVHPLSPIDISGGVPHPADGMWAEPAGYYFDDANAPTKVRLTGTACIEMRRDARRVLQVTTRCP